MTAAEIVSQADITTVWRWLGGSKLRGNRGIAFWRPGADGYNVALDSKKGVWIDQVTKDGGGILDLVCLVQGSSRRDAFRWLASQLGIPIDHPLSAEEKREYAQRRERAEALAATLTTFRARLIQRLVLRRNQFWDSERRWSTWAREHMHEADHPNWEKCWQHAQDDKKGDTVNAQIEYIEQMDQAELLALYRRVGPIPLDPDEVELNRKLAAWEASLELEAEREHDGTEAA